MPAFNWLNGAVSVSRINVVFSRMTLRSVSSSRRKV
jgi:hypothetical protein